MAAPLLTARPARPALIWGQTPVESVRLSTSAAALSPSCAPCSASTAGEPLSRDEIRAGVQALLATGPVRGRRRDGRGRRWRRRGRPSPPSWPRASSRVSVTGLPRKLRREVLPTLGVARGRLLLVAPFERALGAGARRPALEGLPGGRPRARPRLRPRHGTVPRDHGRPPRAAAHPGRICRRPGCEISRAEAPRGLRAPARRACWGRQARRGRGAASPSTCAGRGWWEAEVSGPDVTVSGDTATAVLSAVAGPGLPARPRGPEGRRRARRGGAAVPVRKRDVRRGGPRRHRAGRRGSRCSGRGTCSPRRLPAMERDGEVRVLMLEVAAGPADPPSRRSASSAATRSLTRRSRTASVPSRAGPGAGVGSPWTSRASQADVTSLLATFQERGYADVVGRRRRASCPRARASRSSSRSTRERASRSPRWTSSASPRRWPSRAAAGPGGPWSQLAEERTRAARPRRAADAGFADARRRRLAHLRRGRLRGAPRGDPARRSSSTASWSPGSMRTRRRTVLDAASGSSPARRSARPGSSRRSGACSAWASSTRSASSRCRGRTAGRVAACCIQRRRGAQPGLLLRRSAGTPRRKAQISFTWSELSLFGSAAP